MNFCSPKMPIQVHQNISEIYVEFAKQFWSNKPRTFRTDLFHLSYQSIWKGVALAAPLPASPMACGNPRETRIGALLALPESREAPSPPPAQPPGQPRRGRKGRCREPTSCYGSLILCSGPGTDSNNLGVALTCTSWQWSQHIPTIPLLHFLHQGFQGI